MTTTSLICNQGIDNPIRSSSCRTCRLETLTQTPTNRRRNKEEVALKVPVLYMYSCSAGGLWLPGCTVECLSVNSGPLLHSGFNVTEILEMIEGLTDPSSVSLRPPRRPISSGRRQLPTVPIHRCLCKRACSRRARPSTRPSAREAARPRCRPPARPSACLAVSLLACPPARSSACFTVRAFACSLCSLCSLTRPSACSPIRPLAYLPVRPFACSPVCQPARSPVYQLACQAHSPVRPFAHSPACLPPRPPVRPIAR